ncbi:MAG: GIY-YIG nuclease family protein [Oligoflexia bacterium]|nr:GIY-YIG nuclease family protein [Oligoflexia bacterium]
MILEDAKKYESRTGWYKASPKLYRAAIQREILKQACRHMFRLGNKAQCYIYILEFQDKSFYVGITANPQYRLNHHLTRHPKIKIKSKTVPYKFLLSQKLYPAEIAAKKEAQLIQTYLNKGWSSIGNPKRAGHLGGAHRKYTTKKQIYEVAAKCKSRTDFIRNYVLAYVTAISMGIVQEVLSQFKPLKKLNGYWNTRTIKYCLSKSATWKDFRENYPQAYGRAQIMGILDSLKKYSCHFGISYEKKPPGYWSIKRHRDLEIKRLKKKFKNQQITIRIILEESSGLYRYFCNSGQLQLFRKNFNLKWPSRS